MKKTILFCAFLIPFFISAQQQFRAGLSAGVMVTDLNGADTRDGDNDFNKPGLHFGGFVNTVLNEKNLFQFGIHYSQRGTMQRPDSMNNGYFKFSIEYAEIPFVFRHHLNFNVGKKPTDKFDLEFGGSAGILVRSRYDAGNGTNIYLPSDINKFIANIFMGVDYSLSSNVYLSFRYLNSVTNAVHRNAIPGYLLRYSFNRANNMAFEFAFNFVLGKQEERPEQAEGE